MILNACDVVCNVYKASTMMNTFKKKKTQCAYSEMEFLTQFEIEDDKAKIGGIT